MGHHIVLVNSEHLLVWVVPAPPTKDHLLHLREWEISAGTGFRADKAIIRTVLGARLLLRADLSQWYSQIT
jgi:hypothetical protein